VNPRHYLILVLALAAIVTVLLWKPWHRPPPGPRELTRSQLDLRDGRVYASGEAQPFAGHLIEDYKPGVRKLTIEVRDGKLHGRSCGWFPEGQPEIDEQFVEGTSHGPRTRWHPNGQRKSLAQIEHGQVAGEYLEWHDNGQLAVRMTLRDGQPEGAVEAWHPSGTLKSRVRFEQGRQVIREDWTDAGLTLAEVGRKRD
jgi:antitoxin component YwqK of YwqJK toxin-antitoxin module